jgi:hypothetical protein
MIRFKAGPDNVELKYNWIHNDHFPGALADLHTVLLSNQFKRIIEEKVFQNMTWANIKTIMRIDADVLINLLIFVEGSKQVLFLQTRIVI